MESNFKKSGWILSDSGLKILENQQGPKTVKTLLDRDLREIGAGVIDLQKGRFESIETETVVLMILKIKNVSAPKASESSTNQNQKLLKITLTDGVNTHSAIEMEPTSLSVETKPGTKIALKIKQMKMSNGHLLFTPKNIEVLGGYVEALVTKWEVSRSLAGMKGSRSGIAGGPPPFIPFGQKIQQNVPNAEKGFKSLQSSKTKENENDDSEFKAQRQDAIAEASKVGTKKTFGGGTKTLVDSNVQKVIDKGFTEEQATTALKFSRNNVEKALNNLKRREEHQKRAISNDYEPREYSKDKRGGKGSSAEPPNAKAPSTSVSLFDFLEKKFPGNNESNERFENKISSSFRKPAEGEKPWDQKSSHYNKNYERERQDYGGRDNRNDRSERSYQPREDNRRDGKDSRENPRENYRENRDNRDSKYQQSSYPLKSNATISSQYQKVSNGSSNSGNFSGGEKGKYQKPDYNSNKFTGGNNNRDTRDSRDFRETRDTRDNSYKSRTAPPSKYYNEQPNSNDYQKSSRNVTESMEKMSLKGNHQQQYKASDTKLNATNYPPLTPSTTTEPLPKPKTYPSKPGIADRPRNSQPSQVPIVGFQNKEANEHAKNVLKTKNVQQTQQQPTKPSPNWQQQQKSSQHVNKSKQPPPPFSNPPGIAQAAPAQMHSLPQPFAHPSVIHAMSSVIPANSQPFHPSISYPAPIILQTVAPPPGMGPQSAGNHRPMMKSGDLCLAKYWEDGQFYNAKITGVSESTYVVLFMEYGNAEEVSKTDCVPLACPTPSSNFVQAPLQQNYQRASSSHQQSSLGKSQPRRN